MLTKDVENVGRAGDVKDVADGYGRNFLLRRKLAVLAGRGAEAEAKRLKEAAVKRETKDRVEAQALADEIHNKTVVVRLKMGAEDKAFGSITNQDIASALKAQHRVEVDRHKIDLKEPIKTLGEHQVSLKLHRDVDAHVNVIVTQDRKSSALATTIPLTPGRVPPHDLDAEMSVVGSILLDPLSIAKILQFLHPEDFYRENNGQIYRAALDLFAAGEPIDNVTLAAQLQTMGLLDRVGGRAQLASMQGAVPTAANIEYYGRIVKEKAYKRRLISAGSNIAGFGYDDGIEAEEAINQAQSLVFGVADDRDQRELSKLYDLLGPAMERISLQMESGQGIVGIPTGFHDLDRMTGGFKDSDLIIVAGRPAMGKCARANTLIDDPDTGARITLEECIRRRVPHVLGFTTDGRVAPQDIAEWVDSGIKPCFKVTTRTGRSVEVTGHHPFLTVRGWQPLHDIVVGDRIAVPRAVPCFGTDDSVSMEMIRLLGYFIAEGALTMGTPSITNADSEIVDDYIGSVINNFQQVRIRRRGIAYFASGQQGRKNNPLREWLKSLGLWGKKAEHKRFPDCVWRWDKPRLAEFVKAIMSCDGTIYAMGGYPRMEFAVASEVLAQAMHRAFAGFGILAKLWRKKDGCCRVEITEPASVDLYQRTIGWIGEKSSRFAPPPNYRT